MVNGRHIKQRHGTGASEPPNEAIITALSELQREILSDREVRFQMRFQMLAFTLSFQLSLCYILKHASSLVLISISILKLTNIILRIHIHIINIIIFILPYFCTTLIVH